MKWFGWLEVILRLLDKLLILLERNRREQINELAEQEHEAIDRDVAAELDRLGMLDVDERSGKGADSVPPDGKDNV